MGSRSRELKTAFPPHHMPRQDLPEGKGKGREKEEQEVIVNEPGVRHAFFYA